MSSIWFISLGRGNYGYDPTIALCSCYHSLQASDCLYQVAITDRSGSNNLLMFLQSVILELLQSESHTQPQVAHIQPQVHAQPCTNPTVLSRAILLSLTTILRATEDQRKTLDIIDKFSLIHMHMCIVSIFYIIIYTGPCIHHYYTTFLILFHIVFVITSHWRKLYYFCYHLYWI